MEMLDAAKSRPGKGPYRLTERKVQIITCIEPGQYEALWAEAARQETSISAVVRDVLTAWMAGESGPVGEDSTSG